MTKYYILLPLLLLTLFSCRKDDVVEDETVVLYNENEQSSQLSGQIVDESGKSLEGVLVQFDNVSISTDEYGYFSFEELAFSISGIALKATKEGYIPSIKKVYPKTEQKQFIRFALVKNDNEGLVFPANDGGKVQSTQGYSVTFTSNSIIYENGADYTGIVHVQSHFYAPNDENLDLTMPGDLSGINKSGKVVQLETFGMLYVSLTDDQGNALNLKDGHTAELRVPIVNTSFKYPEETILWSLDENNGTWVEEGIAIKEGNEMVGQVSHFSYWNYDNSYEPVIIRGALEDEDGNPLREFPFLLKLEDGSVVVTAKTDKNGDFSGPAPIKENLVLSLQSFCYDPINIAIGPYSSDMNIGVVKNGNPQKFQNFKVEIENCHGEPIINGILVLTINNTREYVFPIPKDGVFNWSIPNCINESISLKAIDLNAFTESDLIDTVMTGLSLIDMGIIRACEEAKSFISISVDGQNFNYDDALVQVKGQFIDIESSNNNHFIRIDLEDLSSPAVERHIVRSGAVFLPKGCNYLDQNFPCKQNVNLQMNQINNLSGEIIKGEITGVLGGFGFGDAEIEVQFSLQIDEVWEEIQGRVWEDLNFNGYQDSEEPSFEGATLSSIEYDGSTNYPYFSTSKSDGSYVSYGNPLTENILQIEIPEDYYLTEQNNGSDKTLDSDFNPINQKTQPLDLSNGPLSNIDAGLLIAGSRFYGLVPVFDFCETDNYYCVRLSLKQNEISVENIVVNQNNIETINTGPVSAPFDLCGLEYGSTAFISIYLSNGAVYNESRMENNTFQLRIDIEESIENCSPLAYSVKAIPSFFGSNQLNYIWSNNETTQSISPTLGNTYTVTVTDNILGCSQTSKYEAKPGNFLVKGQLWIDKAIGSDNILDNLDDLNIENHVIELYSSDGTLIFQTLSRENGRYHFFKELEDGSYYLKTSPPKSNLTFVTPFIGGEELIDSDADQFGKTIEFFVNNGSCSILDGINFGFKSK